MIVVPVFITNCQVSGYLKNGPLMPQTITIVNAEIKAIEFPGNIIAAFANRSNNPFLFNLLIFNKTKFQQRKRHKFYNLMAP